MQSMNTHSRHTCNELWNAIASRLVCAHTLFESVFLFVRCIVPQLKLIARILTFRRRFRLHIWMCRNVCMIGHRCVVDWCAPDEKQNDSISIVLCMSQHFAWGRQCSSCESCATISFWIVCRRRRSEEKKISHTQHTQYFIQWERERCAYETVTVNV